MAVHLGLGRNLILVVSLENRVWDSSWPCGVKSVGGSALQVQWPYPSAVGVSWVLVLRHFNFPEPLWWL